VFAFQEWRERNWDQRKDLDIQLWLANQDQFEKY
jgi:hypothetical protein